MLQRAVRAEFCCSPEKQRWMLHIAEDLTTTIQLLSSCSFILHRHTRLHSVCQKHQTSRDKNTYTHKYSVKKRKRKSAVKKDRPWFTTGDGRLTYVLKHSLMAPLPNGCKKNETDRQDAKVCEMRRNQSGETQASSPGCPSWCGPGPGPTPHWWRCTCRVTQSEAEVWKNNKKNTRNLQ